MNILTNHLGSILALAGLCAAWVIFQQWLARIDPDGRRIEDAGSQGCGSCSRERTGQCRREE
jgi:hypothetical protein